MRAYSSVTEKVAEFIIKYIFFGIYHTFSQN